MCSWLYMCVTGCYAPLEHWVMELAVLFFVFMKPVPGLQNWWLRWMRSRWNMRCDTFHNSKGVHCYTRNMSRSSVKIGSNMFMMTQYSSSSHVISVLWKKLERNNPNKKVEKEKNKTVCSSQNCVLFKPEKEKTWLNLKKNDNMMCRQCSTKIDFYQEVLLLKVCSVCWLGGNLVCFLVLLS